MDGSLPVHGIAAVLVVLAAGGIVDHTTLRAGARSEEMRMRFTSAGTSAADLFPTFVARGSGFCL